MSVFFGYSSPLKYSKAIVYVILAVEFETDFTQSGIKNASYRKCGPQSVKTNYASQLEEDYWFIYRRHVDGTFLVQLEGRYYVRNSRLGAVIGGQQWYFLCYYFFTFHLLPLQSLFFLYLFCFNFVLIFYYIHHHMGVYPYLPQLVIPSFLLHIQYNIFICLFYMLI